MRYLGTALCTALLSPLAGAQLNALGEVVPGSRIDVTAKATAALGSTWGVLAVGCCRDLQGNYWVSSGNPTAGQPGKYIKFDAAGNYVANVNQPTYATTAFAIRDLCVDNNGIIFGGMETANSGGKIPALDPVAGALDPTKDWTAPTSVTTLVRGLAFDPLGNGGQGSMYTTNFTTNPIIEFRKDGSVIRTIPIANVGNAGAPYGVAVDPVRRTLWAFCQTGSARGTTLPGTGCVGIELDLVTGLKTGVMFYGDSTVPSPAPLGGIAGGCDYYLKAGKPTQLLLSQATSDTLYEVGGTFSYGNTCGGNIGMSGDVPYGGNNAWAVTLKNSTAGSALLMLSSGEGLLPVGPPFFSPGCQVLVSLAPLLVTFPLTPVTGGSASQSLPVPIGFPVPVSFQWVELAASLTPPVKLSNAGKTIVMYP